MKHEFVNKGTKEIRREIVDIEITLTEEELKLMLSERGQRFLFKINGKNIGEITVSKEEKEFEDKAGLEAAEDAEMKETPLKDEGVTAEELKSGEKK